MTREGKIIIAILVAAIAIGAYGFFELKERVLSAERRASVCSCPTSNAAQVAVSLVQRFGRAAVASHSYLERLVEGLVRNRGLPLQAARKALAADLPGGLPAGWRWLRAWEKPGAGKP